MASISTVGFAIIVVSILIMVYPMGWFPVLMMVLLFATVGWVIMEIGSQIEGLNSQVKSIRREVEALRRKIEGDG
ncbi:hypothetical protein E3E26_08260 [Thermococcus sp. LS1]|uniref:FHIPEP family type III secretion protein n=1 Tax=Thermococcus sp. LS1 TaxID=1638259 RepID=UPI00143C77EC|nr:FHIPEP family type III secretion protein [Thermococcus sp. LS1]NJD99772.1 hypothetical protein [Thermococcus sp. LS1]